MAVKEQAGCRLCAGRFPRMVDCSCGRHWCEACAVTEEYSAGDNLCRFCRNGPNTIGVAGVGPDAPIVTNENGGKQSASPYRCDLLPPLATLAVAKVLAHGAEKYEPWNWLVIPVEDHLNHALVHALAFIAGDTTDDHLGHFACRALMALDIHLREKGKNNV